MACFKCSVTNTGSTLQYFDYQRCADYLTWYQVELYPGQVRRLWETSGSFRTPYDKPTIVFNCEPYPPAAKITTTTTTITPTPTSTPIFPTPTSTLIPPTATPIPTATSVPTATPAPTATSTPAPTATSTPIPTATLAPTATPAPTATETPTPTPTTPPLNACYPLYFYNISGTLNYFDPSTYTTSFFFDFESAISAMTRVDDNLILYDGVDTIHLWDMTGYPPVETSQVNMSAFTQSGSDIYGLGPFTSTTELLVSDNTNGLYVADISTSPATRTLLFNSLLSNARCNILRDNNLGITYLALGTSNISAFYDDGSQYSTTTITGTTRGLFRDELTAEIYAINDIGDVYYIPQLSGTVTSYYVSGITPDNIVLNGVAQSNNCTPNPYGFKLSPANITATTLTFTADTFTWIDWGDGSPYSTVTGSTSKGHTYASPYTGDITVYTYDNFANLRGFYVNTGAPLSATSVFSASEFQKITGLQYYQSNPYAMPYVMNGGFSQMPGQLEVFLPFSTETYLTGYTNELPSTLIKANVVGHGYGDVQYLPSTLVDFRMSYCSFSGNVANINTPNLELIAVYGNDTMYGDTSGLPSSLNYISIPVSNNTISGNTANLPKVTQSAYLTAGGYKPTIVIYGNNTISGDTSGFVSPINRLDIGGQNTISGDTSGFPNTIQSLLIQGNNTISGQLSGFTFTGNPVTINIAGYNTISGDGTGKPSGITSMVIQNINTTTANTLSGNISTYSGTSLTSMNIGGANVISGDTSDIPRNMVTFILDGFNTISGDCANLPNNANQTYTILGNNTISGDCANIPSTFTSLSIKGNNTISGNISNIPSGVKAINIDGNNTISGNIGVQNGITSMAIDGNNTITGPLSGLSSTTLVYLDIRGNNTITGPVTGINLGAVGFQGLYIYTTAGGGLTSSEVDDLLIYLTTINWATGGYKSVSILGSQNAAPGPAGLAAKATLLAPPISVSVVNTN